MIPEGLQATLVLLRHGESVMLSEGRLQGQADSPLSALGLRQAELAGARLASRGVPPMLPIPVRPPLEIVHSPLMRAAQTAQRAAEALAAGDGVDPPMRREPALAEIAQGRWEGVLRSEVEATDGATLAGWRSRPLEVNAPGGERVVEVAVRVRGAIDRALANLQAAQASEAAHAARAAQAVQTSQATNGSAAAAGLSATAIPAGTALPASLPLSGYPGDMAPDRPWSLLVAHDGVFKVLLLTLFDLPLERYWSFPFGLAAISVIELHNGRPILRTHNSTQHLAPLAERT